MSADGSRAGAPGAPALVPEAPAAARIRLAGAEVVLRPTGALYWPDGALLCVHDLHLARDGPPAGGEVSAHFHPKARLASRGVVVTRRCFLADSRRVILPAFGTYTGGLDATDRVFDRLLARDARAFLLGGQVTAVPCARPGA